VQRTIASIPHQRLQNQLLTEHTLTTPHAVVSHFGAVQAQDYLGALWAIGRRLTGVSEIDVEREIAARRIVRCWPMRGTLHFVAAEDVRWMLELLAPRVLERHRKYLEREFEVDVKTFGRCRKLAERALRGGNILTRSEMYALFDKAGIATTGSRGLRILFALAHERIICFGSRRGKQPTFVLLDDWLPASGSKSREEALGELARRYFTSHGPATAADFGWWSGLTTKEVNEAIALASEALDHERINDQTLWFSRSPKRVALEQTDIRQRAKRNPPTTDNARSAKTVQLLPPFDEYTVAYKSRHSILDTRFAKRLTSGWGMLSAVVVIDGRVVGNWKRALRGRDAVVIDVSPFRAITARERRALENDAADYATFLGRDGGAVVRLSTPQSGLRHEIPAGSVT
jgi:hypothetical protein